MTGKPSPRAGRLAGLVAAGLLVGAAGGCALLGPSDWNCSDEATPMYATLEAKVKQWSKTPEVNMELVGDDCGQSGGYRFIEIVTPSAALEEHLKTICKTDSQQQVTCTSDGLTFSVQVVEQPDRPRVFGLVLRQS